MSKIIADFSVSQCGCDKQDNAHENTLETMRLPINVRFGDEDDNGHTYTC